MNTLPLLVLFALFDLAREDRRAHLGNVAIRLSSSRKEVVDALRHLERRGLVDAAACRLTLRGLTAAAALRRERAEHGACDATPASAAASRAA